MRNVFLAVLLLMGLGRTAWAQAVIGSVDALAGTATIVPAGGSAGPLLIGQTLREGAVVQTGPDSRLRLALGDGSSLTLGPDSGLRLDHLARAGDVTPSRFAHLVGFLRAAVAPQRGHAGGLEVSTDADVAAVRGTVWIQRATPGTTETFVAVGRVLLRGAGGAVTLGRGQGVTYHADGPHAPVLRWAPAKIAAFDAATRLP